MRDDEAIVGAPRVHAKAALLTPPAHEGTVVHLALDAKAVRHLIAPLQAERRRADDEHEVHPLAQHQLLEYQTGLDRLAEAHVVCNKQVGAGQLQGLFEGGHLVRHDLDACPVWRLEQVGVRGRDGAPAQRIEVSGEGFGCVDLLEEAHAATYVGEYPCAQLQLPKYFEASALVVVV